MALFAGYGFFLLPSGVGMGKARLDFFRRRITSNGGLAFDELDSLLKAKSCSCHLVVVDDSLNFEAVNRKLKLDKRGILPPFTSIRSTTIEFHLVTSKWLSESLRENQKASFDNHRVVGAPVSSTDPVSSSVPSVIPTVSVRHSNLPSLNEDEPSPSKIARKTDDSAIGPNQANENVDDDPHFTRPRPIQQTIHPAESIKRNADVGSSAAIDDPGSVGNSDLTEENPASLPPGNWLCSQASAPSDGESGNLNSAVIDRLEELCRVYKTTKDPWRRLSYQKAISGPSAVNYGVFLIEIHGI